MTRWETGSAEVESLIAKGRLQVITGAAADGPAFLDRADRILSNEHMSMPTWGPAPGDLNHA